MGVRRSIRAGRWWTRSSTSCGGVRLVGPTSGFPAVADRLLVFQPVGTVEVTGQILPIVRRQLRTDEGRAPEPIAGIIDSQSVEGAGTVGQDSRGYDAGKKINGRKRFIVTDTLGLLLTTMVCSASVQGRDGAKPIPLDLFLRTRVRFVYADAGFAGRPVRLGEYDPAGHRRDRTQTA